MYSYLATNREWVYKLIEVLPCSDEIRIQKFTCNSFSYIFILLVQCAHGHCVCCYIYNTVSLIKYLKGTPFFILMSTLTSDHEVYF